MCADNTGRVMFHEIAVSIEPLSDNTRGMLRGVMDYVGEQPNLQLFKLSAVPYVSLAQLQHFDGDGAVCVVETPAELNQLAELAIPKVSVSLHQHPPDGIPTVHSDNRAIGALAADHLRESGLTRFAFAGHLRWHHNAERFQGFRDRLHKHGHDCELVEVAFASGRLLRPRTYNVNRRSLANRLKGLRFPVGIFAAHDEFAHEVLEALRERRLRVPYDAAVIGVNNHRLICETSDPPLSSIAQSSHRIGYTAAKMLHEMIQGKQPPTKPILISPGGLFARRSSDFTAVDDEVVVQAMNFIRTRCGEPITAADVVEQSRLSRRTLDKRFLAAVGHPAAEEIRLARIKKAREQLMSTNMQVVMVGLSCGYDSPSGFVRAFREATGLTPQQYRQQARASSLEES